MNPEPAGDRGAFWSYEDLALFIGATLPAFFLAVFITRPIRFPNEGVKQIAFQALFYLLLTMVLYALIARYGRPVWRSLGWTLSFRWAPLCAMAGPAMAIGLAAFAAMLHAPPETTIQNLVTDRLSRIAVALFVSFLGPLFEELVFRGFLLPLFERSSGGWAAIFLTAIPFALLHGTTVHWSWQALVVIAIAGVVFGFVRVRTGSTAASALVHVGYNSTLFAVYLIQNAV
jgi:membrane protease YdiL (CAAX protease family)